MLQITTPTTELWDEEIQEFITIKSQILQLEHSLVSISKWESKWCIPFLTKEGKSSIETLDYFKCMTLTQNVKSGIYECFTIDNITKINEYVELTMTATTINDNSKRKINDEQITSELIYYWMIALNIPFECQKWHLNRLLTLIRVCNLKNKPPTKRSAREIMSRNTALNASRKKELNTKG